MDSEGNIRLGDFGLATKRTEKADMSLSETETSDLFETAEANAVYDAIEDISPLLNVTSPHSSMHPLSSAGESMTGGVGTTFYRAPEQEGFAFRTKSGSDGSYNVQADIFSLGVILFEMFFPPFDTVSILFLDALIFRTPTNPGILTHGTCLVHGTISNADEITRRPTIIERNSTQRANNRKRQ